MKWSHAAIQCAPVYEKQPNKCKHHQMIEKNDNGSFVTWLQEHGTYKMCSLLTHNASDEEGCKHQEGHGAVMLIFNMSK